jgi:undecaprenyl-diphosphatase
MTSVGHLLGQLPPAAAYGLLALALLIESNIVVGAFVPTLTMMVTAGALARTGYLRLPVVIAVAACAVVLADVVSYRTGRFLGTRLRTGAARRIPASAWNRAESLMARHGGRAVFVARFIPLLRSLTPHLAGATGVPYRRVAPYSAGAVLVWAPLEAGSGYLGAGSAERVLTTGGPILFAAVVIAVGIAVLVLKRRTSS